MNTLELTDKRESLKTRGNAILQKAQGELRKLNEDEQKEFNSITEEVRSLDLQIEQINNKNSKTKPNKTEKRMEKFSLLKAINDVANNRPLDERSQEVVNEGIKEMRASGQSHSGQIQLPMEYRADIKAATLGAGQEAVAEEKLDILEPLRANLALVQAGATYMSGLVGDVSIPVYSGSNCTWEGEVAAAHDGAGTFSEVKLQPKRLTAFVDISKQFLNQTSPSAEAMLQNDIVRAIAEKLESTILGAGAGSGTEPKGLLNAVGADGAAPTYADMVKMETTLESANVRGDIKFIVSPSAKGDLKSTERAKGFPKSIMEDNEINGYPVICTSAVAGKGVIMANWSDLVIGQWGAIDLTVDPFTKAADGKVRLVVNAYFDAKPRRDKAFAKKVLHS